MINSRFQMSSSVWGIVILLASACIYLFQQNMVLQESINNRISDLEKHCNDKEIEFTYRMQSAESKLIAIEKARKISSVDDAAIDAKIREYANYQSEQIADVENRIRREFDGFNRKINGVESATNLLNKQTLQVGRANICLFSTIECPIGFSKVGTFGTVVHGINAESPPVGYRVGDKHNEYGWNWLHGEFCCVSPKM